MHTLAGSGSRDPRRIERILNAISYIWKRNPDLRLGQLLYNFADFTGDIYNYEDFRTEEKLMSHIVEYMLEKEDSDASI